ncbi:hypothetical protein DPMN_117017 [Dreissena polymorpha]|uniref:Uncharacterized protein n=1 Tax=Dreissena polymorpha TaxID=45954 RepID=A0A9D4KPV4_DREPO|nr:hypothetical protein DPMN_117017 [Dreissena polymorpha]
MILDFFVRESVESFLKVSEVFEERTLVLQVFLNDDYAVDDLFNYSPPSSESSLLFSQQFLGLTFYSINGQDV